MDSTKIQSCSIDGKFIPQLTIAVRSLNAFQHDKFLESRWTDLLAFLLKKIDELFQGEHVQKLEYYA